MSVEKFLNTKAGTYLVLGVAGVIVLNVLPKVFASLVEGTLTGAGSAVGGAVTGTVKGLNNAITAVNQGTPYQGYGVIGTLGNVTNEVLGGVPEKIGSFIGGLIFDLKETFDPANPNTALARQFNQANSLLRPEDRLPERTYTSRGASGSW